MIQTLLLFWDNLQDLTRSMGLERHPLRFLVWVASALPAALFAYRLGRFNSQLRRGGTRFAAQRLLEIFYRGLEVVTPVPNFDRGGLVVSNHPGLGDSLALMSVLPPNRYRLVANDRLFFRALPEVYRNLILVPESPQERHRVVGQILQAIGQGLLVVLYPAGAIEPDPAFFRWGWASPEEPLLGQWSPVVELIARRLRQAGGCIYPVMVSDVFASRAVFSWWASLGQDRAEKERRAVGYQLLRGLGRSVTLRVAFGQPLGADELDPKSDQSVTTRLREICKNLAADLIFNRRST